MTIRKPSALVVVRVCPTGYSMGIGGERLHRHSPAMTRVSITSQIAAQAAVCAHMGTDLTMARVKGLNIRWRGMEGGDHVVTVGAKSVYRVDLVINSVQLRVGTIPECCKGIL